MFKETFSKSIWLLRKQMRTVYNMLSGLQNNTKKKKKGNVHLPQKSGTLTTEIVISCKLCTFG